MGHQREQADLCGHPRRREAARPQPRPQRARAPLEQPRQRESEQRPEQAGGAERFEHLWQQVQTDHTRRGRERERARQLEQHAPPPHGQRESAAEQC